MHGKALDLVGDENQQMVSTMYLGETSGGEGYWTRSNRQSFDGYKTWDYALTEI